jgi:hypothetical protein
MRATALAAMAILLAPTHSFAFDVAETDIIGVHLGMAETAVTAALRRQGYAVSMITVPCWPGHSMANWRSILVRTTRLTKSAIRCGATARAKAR